MRPDKDSLGSINIPDHALWGAQAQRAIESFRASGIPISHFPSLIRALAQVKRAAAAVNASQGRLNPALARAIMHQPALAGTHGQACRERRPDNPLLFVEKIHVHATCVSMAHCKAQAVAHEHHYAVNRAPIRRYNKRPPIHQKGHAS